MQRQYLTLSMVTAKGNRRKNNLDQAMDFPSKKNQGISSDQYLI